MRAYVPPFDGLEQILNPLVSPLHKRVFGFIYQLANGDGAHIETVAVY